MILSDRAASTLKAQVTAVADIQLRTHSKTAGPVLLGSESTPRPFGRADLANGFANNGYGQPRMLLD